MGARARIRSPLTVALQRQAPASTLILLVRHGATPTTGKMLPGRAGGLHLAEKGRVQADGVAARIGAMEKPPTAIYASPLERTRETAAPIASALGLRVRTARGLIEVDVGDWTEKSLARLYKTKEWPTVQRWPSGFRFPGGESFTEMSARSMDGRAGPGPRPSGGDRGGCLPRRSDQGGRRRRRRRSPRPHAAPRDLALLGLGPALHQRGTGHPLRELHRLPQRAGPVMTDEADYNDPDHCTVGVIGEVGNRLFLFYCRQGLNETTVKVEKQQVAVLASYLGRIVKELGRPGHLPDDLSFDGTEDPEWVVGTIGVSYDEELDRVVVVLEEVHDEDEERRRERPRAADRPHPRAGGGLRHSRHPPGGGRTAPVPALRAPARPFRPRLSAHERTPPTGDLIRRGRRNGCAGPHRRRHGGAREDRRELQRHAPGDLPAGRRRAHGASTSPSKGERPLWDFPGGLFRREVAAYLLSESLGWGLVPETVERAEGPFGEGSVQRYVPEDGASHYFTLRDDPKWHPTLKRMCAFDVVANNADRKSGHVLLAEDRLWAIDNGLCFNEDDKLRTVIWDFGGEPWRPTTWPRWSACGTTARPPGCASCSRRPRWPRSRSGPPGSSISRPSPSWSTTGDGRRTPGPRLSPGGARPPQGRSMCSGPPEVVQDGLGEDLAPGRREVDAVGRADVDHLAGAVGDERGVRPLCASRAASSC